MLRLRFGAPFVGSLLVARLARLGLAITSTGPTFSTGLAIFVTAVVSVGIGVDDIDGSVKAV